MSKYVLFIATILVFNFGIGQNGNGIVTGKPTDQEVYNDGAKVYHKALIIPFDSKMYMSGIDRDLSMKTGMSFHQIRNNMRFGLTNTILSEMLGKMETISLMHMDTGDVEKELQYIYSSIGYNYSEIPEEQLTPIAAVKPGDDASTKDKVKYKFNNLVNKTKGKLNAIGEDKQVEEQETEQSAGVVNGEVVTSYDDKERYMKTSIHNPSLLTQLNAKFGADVFVFINQLDIEKAADPTQKGLATDDYNRKIKVHYTVFDLAGKEMATGAGIAYFPSTTNDMNVIIKSHFAGIARNIANTTIPEKTETIKDKKKDTRSEIEKY